MTGFLNIFKPEGVSSTFCVNRVKRLTQSACGHMGTLDPLAEGVLPVGVGNATRLFDYFLGKTKRYLARFRFGATTETLDREGEVVRGGAVPSGEEIAAVLPRFRGEIEQAPPSFSAVCVDGRRSYELARKGREVELQPRKVRVDSMRLLDRTAPDEYAFEIVCGAGTYIRALARDVAAALGTQAYMTYLKRTASGIFTEETAVPLDRLACGNVGEFLIETDAVLPFPVYESGDRRIVQGQKIPTDLADGLYKFYFEGNFYGLARAEGGVLKTEKKLC